MDGTHRLRKLNLAELGVEQDRVLEAQSAERLCQPPRVSADPALGAGALETAEVEEDLPRPACWSQVPRGLQACVLGTAWRWSLGSTPSSFRSFSTISRIICSKPMVGSQPSFSLA